MKKNFFFKEKLQFFLIDFERFIKGKGGLNDSRKQDHYQQKGDQNLKKEEGFWFDLFHFIVNIIAYL